MPSIITNLVDAVLETIDDLHPKLKVPAVIITAATIVLGVLAAFSAVPAAVPYTSLATTILTVVIGWLVPSPAHVAPTTE